MPSQVVKATFQNGLLSAVSNVLAQFITCHRAGVPYSLNLVQLMQFVTYAVLSCPPNWLWQNWLEARFPGSPPEKNRAVSHLTTGCGTGSEKTLANGELHRRTPAGQAVPAESNSGPAKLSIKNTAIKFTLDQTIGAAVNTVMFIAGIALLRGQSFSAALSDIQEKFWPMTFAGQKLWPAVSILSFSVIPLEHRMLFGAVAGLFWGIYMSLMSGSPK